MDGAVDGSGHRVGIMGGTFDPIHNGHLCAASQAAADFGLDEVVFVPTGRPWQKAGSGVSDSEHRYAMTLLATSGHPGFRVSRVEIARTGATYTVDTLRTLREQYGAGTTLFFIAGADTLANVMSWESADEVFRLAGFIVVNRPGHELSAGHVPSHAVVSSTTMPAMDISSTQCRRRVAAGEPIWYLTPDPVVRYIETHGLYREPPE